MHTMILGRNLEANVCRSFVRWLALTLDLRDVARVTIDMLPDVALLTIFDFYMDGIEVEVANKKDLEAWHTLVHVCRKWRSVVFGSPRRLNLRLWWCNRTLVEGKLDIWPPLRIVVRGDDHYKWGVGYIIAALKHTDRVWGIDLNWISSSQMERVLAAMQQPFPELTHLKLRPHGETAPNVPASFLGGSAPQLRKLVLDRIPFPGLPQLLVSATRLIHLYLWNVPHSGYISPETMVTCLSVLTRLETLQISFESPGSRPDKNSRCLSPQTRILLPVLFYLSFEGVHEYLEDLVARVDTPLLSGLWIDFLTSGTPQLTQFISRIPKFKAHNEARMDFDDIHVSVLFPRAFDGALQFGISCQESDLRFARLTWLAQVCSSSFPQALIPMVERLYIRRGRWPLNPEDDVDDQMENSQWLKLLRPFTSLKHLYISSILDGYFARAVQGLVGERATEVLPALQTLFVQNLSKEGRFQEAIGSFVAARQVSGRPIAVSHWDGK